MRFLRTFCALVLIGSTLALIISFPAERSYRSRAQLIQRVQVDEASRLLFGDAGTPIGSPQKMIIDDPKAFLPGEVTGGVKQVDENYLVQKGIYPLQLKTVEFFAQSARIISAALALLSLLGFWLTSRRLRVDCPAGPG